MHVKTCFFSNWRERWLEKIVVNPSRTIRGNRVCQASPRRLTKKKGQLPCGQNYLYQIPVFMSVVTWKMCPLFAIWKHGNPILLSGYTIHRWNSLFHAELYFQISPEEEMFLSQCSDSSLAAFQETDNSIKSAEGLIEKDWTTRKANSLILRQFTVQYATATMCIPTMLLFKPWLGY